MRVNEFTDATDHASTDDDAADDLRQVEKLWPHSIGDDDAACLIQLKKSKAKRTKLIDVLSAHRHLGHE